MKGGNRLSCFSASVLVDSSRTKNHDALLKSIKAQTTPLDGFYASVYLDKQSVTNYTVSSLYHSKLAEKMPSVLSRGKKVSEFEQFRLLWDRNKASFDPKKDWVLFTTDDGLWHPSRVERYKAAIEDVAMDHNICCIVSPNQTQQQRECRPIHTSTHVDLALQEGTLFITQQTPKQNETYELYDICVRFEVLDSFMKNAKYLNNRFCDVEFVEYAVTYKERLYAGTSAHWLFYYRAAEPSYVYSTGRQFVGRAFTAKKDIDLIPVVHVIAEMEEIPTLKTTAEMIINNILEQVKDDPTLERMLKLEYQNAKKEKQWHV